KCKVGRRVGIDVKETITGIGGALILSSAVALARASCQLRHKELGSSFSFILCLFNDAVIRPEATGAFNFFANRVVFLPSFGVVVGAWVIEVQAVHTVTNLFTL